MTTDTGTSAEPLFQFGVIADVQYADAEQALSGWGRPRYYRQSIAKLAQAIDAFNTQQLPFILNLGDAVDKRCGKSAQQMLERVLAELNRFRGTVYSTIGNHELYNMLRPVPIRMLRIHEHSKSDWDAYYHFSPHPGYRFIALDSFDIGLFGYPSDHASKSPAHARQVMLAGRKRYNEPHFCEINGAIGPEQLQWLSETLRSARIAHELCIIFTHVPLCPDAAYGIQDAVTWNYRDVQQLMHQAGNVVCCLYGHEHMGGYSVDAGGVHHVALEAVLEAGPGQQSYAVVSVYDEAVEINGVGNVRSVMVPTGRAKQALLTAE
eukprot:TRINITY_DN11548_c0_g1_i1.p1 TRINITY_DN11548_c0_g1~~TRINITY_DN11548_c0_g1_i1.p1  ORF type:complete len:321 (-),score=46.89 TRINITY_DN11548_c0_g1_i1:149-1111(-)